MALETLDDDNQSSSNEPVQTRATVNLGGTKFPVSAGMDSATILRNLQAEMDRRQAAMPSDFMMGLYKASAIAKGSPEAAANMDAQRQAQLNQLFNMKMQAEAFRAAQAQQDRASQTFAAANPNVPAQGAASQGAASQGASLNQNIGSYNSIPGDIKSELYAQAEQEARSSGDPTKALSKYHEKLNKFLITKFQSEQNAANNPENYKQTSVFVPELGRTLDLTPPQVKQYLSEGLRLPDGTVIKYGGQKPTAQPVATQPATAQPATAQPAAAQPAAAQPAAAQPAAQPAAQVPNFGIQPTHIRQVESNNTAFAEGPYVPGQGTAKSSMQVMDATAANPGFGIKPAQLTGDKINDEAERVRVGTEYFNAMKKRYGNDAVAAAAYNWGPGNVDKWIKNGADPSALPASVKDYVSKVMAVAGGNQAGPSQLSTNIQGAAPTPVATKTGLQQPVPSQQSTITPVSPITPVQKPNFEVPTSFVKPYPNPQSKEEVAQNEKALEEFRKQQTQIQTKKAETGVTTAAKSDETERQKAGEFISKMSSEADRADEVIRTANQIIGHATSHPEDFGWSKQPISKGLLGPTLNIVKPIPFLGEDVSQGIEKAVEAFQPEGVAARRDLTNGNAKKLGMDFAAEQFAGSGARLGVGLEKMAADAKTLGTDHTAMTNIANATLIKLAYEKTKEQAAAWRTFKAANPDASPYDFLQSNENQAIKAKFNTRLDSMETQLRQQFPQYFNDSTVSSATSSKPKRPLSEFTKK